MTDAAAPDPAEITFSVLRQGDEEPSGPFAAEDILRLLNEGVLNRSDFVYYEGLDSWLPIEDVFEIHEQISHFVDDGQDRSLVALAFREISQVVTDDENIYFIAVQEKAGLLSKAKRCAAVTDHRLLILLARRNGIELESYRWADISNTLMKDEGQGLATFSALLLLEKRIDIPHIPIRQVQRLFTLSQELRGVTTNGESAEPPAEGDPGHTDSQNGA